MYRVSALSQFDLNARSSVTLLDSAASVHVFNIKERFSNFKRALKGQGLLCGCNVISIEGWGQISLPLKVKGRIKLLTLNNVACISKFPLNLVSLGCLQKRGFDWSHRSGEISKNRLTERFARPSCYPYSGATYTDSMIVPFTLQQLEVPESQVIDERPQLFLLVLPVIFVCFEDVKKLRLSSF